MGLRLRPGSSYRTIKRKLGEKHGMAMFTAVKAEVQALLVGSNDSVGHSFSSWLYVQKSNKGKAVKFLRSMTVAGSWKKASGMACSKWLLCAIPQDSGTLLSGCYLQPPRDQWYALVGCYVRRRRTVERFE